MIPPVTPGDSPVLVAVSFNVNTGRFARHVGFRGEEYRTDHEAAAAVRARRPDLKRSGVLQLLGELQRACRTAARIHNGAKP